MDQKQGISIIHPVTGRPSKPTLINPVEKCSIYP